MRALLQGSHGGSGGLQIVARDSRFTLRGLRQQAPQACKLYFAVVLDLYFRRLVGWSMSSETTAQLVTDALMMAVWRRGQPKELLHHSDQGSQYTSEQFQGLLAELGVTCSMSDAVTCGTTRRWKPSSRVSRSSACKPQELWHAQRSEGEFVRLRGALLQSTASALDNRIAEPGRLRRGDGVSLKVVSGEMSEAQRGVLCR